MARYPDGSVGIATSHPAMRHSHAVHAPLLSEWCANQYQYLSYREDVYGVLRSKGNGEIYCFNKKSPFKPPISIDGLSINGYNVSRFSAVLINCRVLVS
jgi:hypothetical protein